jgi:hypothetical protein
MMVSKKEDFDKKTDVNGAGISLDHPGHCGYEFNPRESAR